MGLSDAIFQRSELLLGKEVMDRISNASVIIFGVGGVGSWCAESLIRSGIKKLTIVDSDRICVTNVNRQAMATSHTIGEVKVEAMKRRLLEINPTASINSLQMIYCRDNAHSFNLDSYDYIIDAIDSLSNKVDLITTATKQRAKFFSSMGAALKVDVTKVKVAEFWRVQGCPLAAAIRRLLKKIEMPAKKFLCVYSDELLDNKGVNMTCGLAECLCPKADTGPGVQDLVNHEWCSAKARINGTSTHITAMFGFMLAGLVIQDIYEQQ